LYHTPPVTSSGGLKVAKIYIDMVGDCHQHQVEQDNSR
jgi:hypothetical protein